MRDQPRCQVCAHHAALLPLPLPPTSRTPALLQGASALGGYGTSPSDQEGSEEEEVWGGPGEDGRAPGEEDSGPLTFESGRGDGRSSPGPWASPGPSQGATVPGGAGSDGWQGQLLALMQPYGDGAGLDLPPVGLSSIGPLHLRFHAFLPPTATAIATATTSAGGSVRAAAPGGSGPPTTASGRDGGGGAVTALFEVVPLRGSPENSPGWSTMPGWPMRSRNPARDAGATLLRYRRDSQQQQQQPGGGSAAGSRGGPSSSTAGGGGGGAGGVGMQVLEVEPHSRQPQDWWVPAFSLFLPACPAGAVLTCLLLC